jgi:hypothetical protein
MEVRHETTVALGALYYLYAVNGGAHDFGVLEAGIAHGWFARESGHQPGCNLTNNCFSEPPAQRAVRERDSRIRRSSGADLDLVGHRERGT